MVPADQISSQIRLGNSVTPGAMWCGRSLLLIAVGLVSLCGPQIRVTGAQEERKPKNQLGELFRQLDRGIRQSGEDIKNEKTARDQIDLRPVQRPEDFRRLQQARTFIEQGKWQDGVEILQYLREQKSDVFSIDEQRQFKSLQTEVDALIAGLPEAGKRSYESRYGTTAQQLLQDGINRQDDQLLILAANLYFHTSAGRSALLLMARNWEDRGEFARAADAWKRLLSGAAEADRGSILQATLRNLTLAGRAEEALALAKPLPNAEQLRNEIGKLQATRMATAPFREAGSFSQYAGAQGSSRDLEISLLPRWGDSLVERYSVQEQIRKIETELLGRNRVLIPTLQPLIVNGNVVFRSLRSLQVRDLLTGKMIWERRLADSPESRLSLSGENSELQEFGDDSFLEQHPLASLMYRSQVYGNLTSDGHRLYSVEESVEGVMSSPQIFWRMQREELPRQTPWEANELTAYDLKTGLIRWQVGGAEIEEAFSRPLAGTHFFSAPTPDGGELFVLGEAQGEISLYCLSAYSGEKLWSQPLASPGRAIREDQVRSHWACQPVIADGMILCPTGTGWMVAVDRTTHRLRWTGRYAPRLDQNQHQMRGGYSVQLMHEINRRWQSVATYVANGKVLVTPLEMPDEFGMTQPMLCCFDLQTGEKLWEQAKGERTAGLGIYLAGVWNQLAIVVGSKGILGRSLEKGGDIQWNVVLPGRPAGRSVLVNDILYVPMEGKRIAVVSLKNPSLQATLQPMLDDEIGNLAFAEGQLISANYHHVAVFPADGQPVLPNSDPESLVRNRLREARLLLAQKKFPELKSLLDGVLQTSEMDPKIREKFLEEQRSALIAQLELQSPDAEQLLGQLKSLIQSPRHQRDYDRLSADFLLKAGDYPAALNAYLEIMSAFPADERITEGTRTMRIDSWVFGRLHQLTQTHQEPAQKKLFDEQVQHRLDQIGSNVVAQDRWARALSFHDLGLKLEHRLAVDDIQRGHLASGLVRLSRVLGSDQGAHHPDALVTMAQGLEQIGWLVDAKVFWERIREFPAWTLPEGGNSKEMADSALQRVEQELRKQAFTGGPWNGPWTIERVGASGEERDVEGVPTFGSGFKSLSALRLELDTLEERLRVTNRQTGEFCVSLPLRSIRNMEHSQNVGCRLMQSLSLAMYHGVLHGVAWPDQKVLWTWEPGLRGASLLRMANVNVGRNFELQPLTQFTISRQFQAGRNQIGYLLAASPRAVLLRCDDWIALDPLTGEELWRDRSTSERAFAQEQGGDWFLMSGKTGRVVSSVINGQPKGSGENQDSLARAISIVDQNLIVIDRNVQNGANKQIAELKQISPQGKVLWKLEIPSEVRMGLPDAETLVWVNADNELSLIDLKQGTQTQVGKIPTFDGGKSPTTYVLSDEERIFVLIDSGDSQPMYVSLPAIRFAGKIMAYDRQGEQLWEYETPFIKPKADLASVVESARRSKDQRNTSRRWPLNVLVQDVADTPLLLMVGDWQDRREDMYFHQLRVIGLDKATGQALIDWERPSESGGFSYLQVSSEKQLLELRTYNERLQLRPQAAASPRESAE